MRVGLILPWSRRRRRAEAAAREATLLRNNVKLLGAELARALYAARLAGPDAPIPKRPLAANLTSRICRQADIESPWLRHWCGRLHMAPLYHRKVWEDCFVPQAIWEAGLLQPGRRALGFAVGREPLPALLAAHGMDVLATDLDPEDPRARQWIATNQHNDARDRLHRPDLIDRAEFEARVRFTAADMAAIPPTLTTGDHDLVWSVCALEHLGSLDAGLGFIRAAMACLRPGGLAVHTTEYNLDPTGPTLERGPTVLYQRHHLNALATALAADGHHMLPLDDAPAAGVLDRWIDLPPFPADPEPQGDPAAPHLRLSLDGFAITSAAIVIRAGPRR